MYPFYSGYPSSSYGTAYPSSSSADAEYLRALAEERAAREQYAAAKRAQEEARQRAARARAARRAYAAPYNSFHDDEYDDVDLDMDLDDAAYYPQRRPFSYAGGERPYGYSQYPSKASYSPNPQYPASPQFSTSPRYSVGPQFANGVYGLTPRQQRALLEEQQRRELLEEQRRRELLELERERRRQEEERLRRILEEERKREEAERRKILEEERKRRAVEEEKLRRAIEEEKLRRAMLEEEAARRERDRAQLRAQQASLEPLLRAFGFVPVASSGSDSDSDKERGRTRNGRGARARTTSPGARRASMPRSPIRPTQSSQPSTSTTHLRPDATPTQRASSPKVTTIPITSPRSSAKTIPVQQQQQQAEKEAPKPQETPKAKESPKPNLSSLDNPTPEQVAAAEKIQETYRSYSVRKQALKSIATLRKRFLTARANFTLPTTLDYETPSGDVTSPDGRPHTTVTVDPSAALPSPSLSAADAQDEDPFKHVPKLAYTPTNAALHGYEEELNRILSALDAIESRGDAGVRAARRELARMVEREAERVERWRGVVWNWWTGHGKERPREEKAQEEQQPAVAPLEATQSTEGAPSTEELQPIPVDRPESAPAEQSEPAPIVEQQMQVEPPTEQSPEQPMETEPVVEESTPKVAPMEVERASEAPTETQSPPTPEIDIPDADASESAPVEIEIEPASRAEPADIDVEPPSSEQLETVAAAPEVPIIEVTEDADRPSTPPLSHEPSETDAEMEVEPQEVHTPPPGEHTPLVVESPPALDLHGPASSDVPQPHEPEAQPQMQQVQGDQQKTQPPAVKNGGTSPLVDRAWDEFYAHDMF
ncbi:hypothetical protein ACG7TL_007692 [Trametes sanguinea]